MHQARGLRGPRYQYQSHRRSGRPGAQVGEEEKREGCEIGPKLPPVEGFLVLGCSPGCGVWEYNSPCSVGAHPSTHGRDESEKETVLGLRVLPGRSGPPQTSAEVNVNERINE